MEAIDDDLNINQDADEVLMTVDEYEKVDAIGNNEPHDDKNESGADCVRKSWVWKHFTYVKGATRVKCPYCNRFLGSESKNNGTSSMGNHLKRVCKKSPVYKMPNEKNQPKLKLKPKPEGGNSLAPHSFNQERCRKSLARMCIKDNRPFSVVDDEGFKEFVWDLNPNFKFPSRWTVARDCLSIYNEEAGKLKKFLKDQTVCLTTDTWTSVQNYNYMCLTAHWVDEDWILRKKILNFCHITNHKGTTIGKLVYDCLQVWGINRVFTITVDNASSNDGAIKYLKNMLKGPHAILDCKYIHLRCCAYIINLIVRDGLEEQFQSICRIRNAVRYVRSSSSRSDSFQESVEKVGISCKGKPCLDVDTRWNSTFLMLETAEKYAAAFDRLYSVDYNYRAYFRGDVEDDGEGSTRKRRRTEKVVGAPQEEDWENARYFVEYLRIFFNVTKKNSGSKYVTSNLFFAELVTMHSSISKMCLSKDEKKKKMAESMKQKYDKYWDNVDNINYLLLVGLVLDPRNKVCYLEYCLGKIHGKLSDKVRKISDQVVKTLGELFDHYKMKNDGVNAKNTASSVVESGLESDEDDDYENFLEARGKGVNQTELEVYLADGMEKRDDLLEVLTWWKNNSLKFPILSKVARHVLAMPITTVASESAFSTGGRVIDHYRSSLSPRTAEALICTQDWIRSTPADLQEMPVNSLQLQGLVEKLEKLEVDELPTKNPTCNDFVCEDWD